MENLGRTGRFPNGQIGPADKGELSDANRTATEPAVRGRVVVAFISGGKDSAAMSLHLTELGIEHRRVFMDTGWESDLTYEYLRGELTRVLGPIDEIRGPRLMEDLVRWKGMFPSKHRRYCTEQLKVLPAQRFLATLDDPVNVVGIRAAESEARSKMVEWERSDAFDCDVWRPILRWSLDDVIAIHKRHGLRPNPLYLLGATRVGCWPCIYARKSEVRLIADKDPARIDRLRVLEAEVTELQRQRNNRNGETFESRGHVAPAWFQAPVQEATGGRMWPIDKVVEWSRTSHGGRQFELFAPDQAEEGCMRWGLCETAGTP